MSIDFNPSPNKHNKYATVDDFKDAIKAYFDSKERDKRGIATLNGLAVHLGLDLSTLKNFPDTEFKYLVDAAITYIAVRAEEQVITSSNKSLDWLERAQPESWKKVEHIDINGGGNFITENALYSKKDDQDLDG